MTTVQEMKDKLTPSDHGERCIGNGEFPGIGCLCTDCNHAEECFPELKSAQK